GSVDFKMRVFQWHGRVGGETTFGVSVTGHREIHSHGRLAVGARFHVLRPRAYCGASQNQQRDDAACWHYFDSLPTDFQPLEVEIDSFTACAPAFVRFYAQMPAFVFV